MNNHVRHITVGEYWIIIEIALDDAALGNRDLLVESLRQSKGDLHFDLTLHGERIHQKSSRIHRDINALDSDISAFADRHPRHGTVDGNFRAAWAAIIPDGNAHSSSGRQFLSPPGFLCRSI